MEALNSTKHLIRETLPDQVAQILSWLLKHESELDYGEIGISLIKHQGKIVKCKKFIEDVQKS